MTAHRCRAIVLVLAAASLGVAPRPDDVNPVRQDGSNSALETPSLLESDPSGWIDIQPSADLSGWTRGAWPATAALGPQQWQVDPASGYLVCDGTGGHDWLRFDRELGDVAFHVEWRFTPVEGADNKYNSGVLVRTAPDLSVWHQAQTGGGRGGHLFGNTLVNGTVQRVNLASDAASRRVKPAGEWNVYELVARGPSIRLWVNGAVTGELPVEVRRGHVGLEGEGYRIEFRNLKIKPLD